MTYWVVAKVNNKLYMAADSRVSIPSQVSPGMKDYADISEKLFATQYSDQKGQSIRLGICTSGTASIIARNNENKKSRHITIPTVLKSFLSHVKAKQVSITSAQNAISLLYQYMTAQYEDYNVISKFSKAKFADYIANTTCFGIGLYYGNSASVAGWNTKKQVTGYSYIEASFDTSCITTLYGKNFSDVPSALKFIGSLEATELNPDPALSFVTKIIRVGSSVFKGQQTIGGHTDVAILSNQAITLQLGLKADVSKTPKERPYMYGSDRTFLPRRHSWPPVTLFNPSRESVSTREQKKQYSTLDRIFGL